MDLLKLYFIFNLIVITAQALTIYLYGGSLGALILMGVAIILEITTVHDQKKKNKK